MVHGMPLLSLQHANIYNISVSKILLDNLVRSSTATSLTYLFTSTVVSLGLTAYYFSPTYLLSWSPPLLFSPSDFPHSSELHSVLSIFPPSIHNIGICHSISIFILLPITYPVHLHLSAFSTFIFVSPSLLSSFAQSHCTPVSVFFSPVSVSLFNTLLHFLMPPPSFLIYFPFRWHTKYCPTCLTDHINSRVHRVCSAVYVQ